MSKFTEQLEKEEKELEEKLFATPKGEATTKPEAGSEKAETEATPVKEQELVTQAPPPVVDEQLVSKREYDELMLRYKNLRSSRDDKLYQAKSQLAAALQTITALQEKLQQLEQSRPVVDPLKDAFTQEDIDALGETAVEALKKTTKKVTEAATKPLQDQLNEERKKRLEQEKLMAENAKQEAYNIFLRRIATAVPEWEEINFDPKFIQWMDGQDYDGTPRKTYFAQAEAQGNAALIIRYMNEYKATKVPPVKEDKLAKKVTPVGDGATPTAPSEGKKEIVSRAFINKFYDDFSKGVYKGRYSEAQAIEAKIDKAIMEGRVR